MALDDTLTTAYAIDCEFYEDGRTADLTLLSIAVVCDDGREFYALNTRADFDACAEGNPWLVDNVFPHLQTPFESSYRQTYPDLTAIRAPREEIGGALAEFLQPEHGRLDPSIWSYFADYDWVCFCWCFGRMLDVPNWLPRYCLDIKQEAYRLGLRRDHFPEHAGDAHSALDDARWHMEVLRWLVEHHGVKP